MEDNGTKKCLLDHISFQVDDGEMLVITGPNGGGKSTLAKVLIGIEKAESGKIFKREDITDYDINHRANAWIGYAFQQPPRFKGMTVQRLLALAAGREMSDVECCKLLSDVGLCAEEYLKPPDRWNALRRRDETDRDRDSSCEGTYLMYF